MCFEDSPPPDWQQVINNIREIRKVYPAPVDSMGCAQVSDRKDKEQRFQVLVSLMLSAQTKDQITWAAVQKLKEKNLCNAKALSEAKEKDIEDLIHPVGFYRRKAVYLKKVAQVLKQEYDHDIPDSVEKLCKLPGVGPKMAHLCMQEAWNVNSGIGVDTHVHRISNRLGWVTKKGTKTPEETRKALESWLPRDYWREINLLLVGFGQTICAPVRPKCDLCYNKTICPSSSVRAKLSTAAAKAGVIDAKTTIKKEVVIDTTTSERKEGEKVGVVEDHAVIVKTEKVEEDVGIGENWNKDEKKATKKKRAKQAQASRRVSKRKR